MAKAEDYAAWIVQNQDKKGTPEFEVVSHAYKLARSQAPRPQEQAPDPTEGMSGLDKFRAGFGKLFVDLARGAGQYTPLVSREDVAESRKLDKSLMNTGAGMAGNMAGSIAAFAPTAFIPGANTITGGALLGAASGLLTPSVSTAETLKNAGIGTAAGAAIPALIQGLKTAKSFVDPLYESGREKIVGNAISNASAVDPRVLAQALKGNRSNVPAVQRTVAEVADNPSLAALQRTASQVSPMVMNESTMRQSANNEARQIALAQATPDKAAAIAARDAAAGQLYRSADSLPVNASAFPAGLLDRPSVKEAIGRAQKLAAERGESVDVQNLTGRGAHYIKMALDDMANSSPASGIGRNEINAIRDTLSDYLGAVEKQIPAYQQARTTYADMSKPINQADILGEIASKATNFRGNMTPAAFANAATDKTAQKVLGRPQTTLVQALEKGQLDTLGAIRDDLARVDFMNTAGKGVGSDTVQKLAYTNMMDQAGIPSFVRNFGPAGIVGNMAQRGAQIVYKDANEKLAEQLARALLNPDEASRLVTGAMVTPQAQALANGLRRGGAALGASVPALIQANQQ